MAAGDIHENYFTLAGTYGPHGERLATLEEAVNAAAEYIGELRTEHPGIEHPEHTVHIEHRQLVENDDAEKYESRTNTKTDSHVARFSHDGSRPHDFEYVERRLSQALSDLRMRVYNDQGEASLGYAQRAMGDLRALANVVERGIEEAQAETRRLRGIGRVKVTRYECGCERRTPAGERSDLNCPEHGAIWARTDTVDEEAKS